MCKFCLTLFFILFFLSDVYSQSDIALGFKFGASLSNISTETRGSVFVSMADRTGFLTGIFLGLMDKHSFNILAEISYERKSTNFKFPDVEGDYRIDYLAYSLKARYKFLKSKVQPFVSGGVKVSVYLNDNVDISGTGASETIESQFSDNCRKTIFAPVFGAGVEFKISNIFALISELSVAPEIGEFFYDRSFEFKAKSFPVSLSAGGKFFIH